MNAITLLYLCHWRDKNIILLESGNAVGIHCSHNQNIWKTNLLNSWAYLTSLTNIQHSLKKG